jgi:hypothetical protein
MRDWQNRRINLILEHYGTEYFRGKTVLEVAAAWGHIGSYFQRELGASVTCTDHYDGWVNIIKERYPDITSYVQNVNDPWPQDVHYDVLIHMGVIYHQPAEVVAPRFREACKICDEMIIETEAIEHQPVDYILALPKPEDLWEPIGTEYCQPSTGYIEALLTDEGFVVNKRIEYAPNRFLWFCKKA